MRLRSLFQALAVAVSIAASACHDGQAVLAPADAVRPVTRGTLQALPEFSNDLSVLGGSLLLPTFDFVEGVKVEIKIEHMVGVGSDSRAPYVNAPSLSLDAKGIWVGGVYEQCYLAAYVSYPSSPGPRTSFGPGNGCTYPRTMTTYVDTGLVRGAGSAIRTPPIPEEGVPCDTIVCHTYDGAQTISITPLAGDLAFHAEYQGQNAQTIYVPPFTSSSYYRDVTFRESTVPPGLPFKPLNRSWRRADTTFVPGFNGTTDINQCPNGSPPLFCYIYVKESGVMTTQTRVNGVVHVDSACVQCAVNNGSVGDSLLNADEVRTRMIELAILGNGTNVNPANRTEQDLLIARDDLSGKMVTLSITPNWTHQCNSEFNPKDPAAPGLQGYTIMAYVHTHPQYRNEVYTCPDGRNTTGEPGGSVDDWKMLKTINRPPSRPSGKPKILMYVMANDYLYRMDPDLGVGPDKIPLMRWDKGRCKWVRFLNQP